MCTVSFYQDETKTVITSNRDENVSRLPANPPKLVNLGDQYIYYPTDQKANGTWFGVKNNGDTLVLINGADKKHIAMPPYKKSRGLILLDLLKAIDILSIWNAFDLSNIEPFTVFCYVKKALFQLQWNGQFKSESELATNKTHIWSSPTLYPYEINEQRKVWLSDFVKLHSNRLSAEDLIDFHTKTRLEDPENGLIIKRKDGIMTKNITQCVILKYKFMINHYDLILNEKSKIITNKNEIVVA